MHIVSVTNYKIDNNFPDFTFNQSMNEGMYITAITDSFFSKVIFSHDKLSIIESPLNQDYIDNNLTYNKIEYNNEKKEITFYKSTLSGRPLYYYIDLKGNFYCSSHIKYLKKIGVKNVAMVRAFQQDTEGTVKAINKLFD